MFAANNEALILFYIQRQGLNGKGGKYLHGYQGQRAICLYEFERDKPKRMFINHKPDQITKRESSFPKYFPRHALSVMPPAAGVVLQSKTPHLGTSEAQT
ncbi:hypothetical protein BCV71DRAFT_242261 [Rhizopus microsporus]|uniref:Uncharacterized protein n=1 Tax=Rhizopus microsporus TaxID=58291 RepID=A0A1X0S7P0_RHIZD|nr:hypothetical protein BCV71DRAFT_242261 [Rhizopus microsporus]